MPGVFSAVCVVSVNLKMEKINKKKDLREKKIKKIQRNAFGVEEEQEDEVEKISLFVNVKVRKGKKVVFFC